MIRVIRLLRLTLEFIEAARGLARNNERARYLDRAKDSVLKAIKDLEMAASLPE